MGTNPPAGSLRSKYPIHDPQWRKDHMQEPYDMHPRIGVPMIGHSFNAGKWPAYDVPAHPDQVGANWYTQGPRFGWHFDNINTKPEPSRHPTNAGLTSVHVSDEVVNLDQLGFQIPDEDAQGPAMSRAHDHTIDREEAGPSKADRKLEKRKESLKEWTNTFFAEKAAEHEELIRKRESEYTERFQAREEQFTKRIIDLENTLAARVDDYIEDRLDASMNDRFNGLVKERVEKIIDKRAEASITKRVQGEQAKVRVGSKNPTIGVVEPVVKQEEDVRAVANVPEGNRHTKKRANMTAANDNQPEPKKRRTADRATQTLSEQLNRHITHEIAEAMRLEKPNIVFHGSKLPRACI
ncbi:hypothetical protein B0T20DRAFT_479471 [Sordaria brevicollis]|uniref:Uncharacterized protein n=1 Tax=Sordaria brevicollis TaxID=83679 RepID=A0AAE0UC63_SORBR|nr:hypothetical protein B0T20DRAFT_479471 [Sordaria brevicollis]